MEKENNSHYPDNLINDIKKNLPLEKSSVFDCISTYGITRAIHTIQDTEKFSPLFKEIHRLYYFRGETLQTVCRGLHISESKFYDARKHIIQFYKDNIFAFTDHEQDFMNYLSMRSLPRPLYLRLMRNYNTPSDFFSVLQEKPSEVWNIRNIGSRDVIHILLLGKSRKILSPPSIEIEPEIASILKANGISDLYLLFDALQQDMFLEQFEIRAKLSLEMFQSIIKYTQKSFYDLTGKEFPLVSHYENVKNTRIPCL